MRESKQNEIIICTGKGGCGKTTIILAYMYEQDYPFIAIDPQHEITTQRSDYIYFKSPETLWGWITNNELMWRYNDLRLIVQSDDEAGTEKLLEKIYSELQEPERLQTLKRNNKNAHIILFVDEIDSFFSDFKKTSMTNIVKYGRNREISILGTLKRPANISKMLVSQAKKYVFVQNTLELDIKFIKDNCGEACAETVKSLEKFEFVCYDNNMQDWYKDKINPAYLQYI